MKETTLDFTKFELKAEIELLQTKINRLKFIQRYDFDSISIKLLNEGCTNASRQPLIQSNFPFNLRQELNLLIDDSIEYWQRQCNSLQSIINGLPLE